MAFGKKKNEEEKPPKLTAEEKKAARANRKAEMKELRAKRKELKKDLKLNGMKGRADMEFFAKELGLSYPENSLPGIATGIITTLSQVGVMIKASLTLKSLLVLITALLAATFMIAYITEEKGHFTVNLTADMMREGYQLSLSPDFSESTTRLFADEIRNSNATSIYEINRGIDEVDGSHNGPGYMAYTFYLKNSGEMASNYGYTVNILSETLGTADAAWVMFYEGDEQSPGSFNSKQIIYARAVEETGKAECLWGYPHAPFIESAYYPDKQYFEEDGMYGIRTTPFVDKNTALQGYVEDFQPGEVKKYTAIVWLEGDDPDCNNEIMGGHVGFNIQFERIGDEESGYFKGLFRREYQEYFGGDLDYETTENERNDRTKAHEE